MVENFEEQLSSKQSEELLKLKRRSRRHVIFPIIIVAAIVLTLIAGFRGLGRYEDRTGGLNAIRSSLLSNAGYIPWVQDLVDGQDRYRSWLLDYGTFYEVRSFDSVSHALMQSAFIITGYASRSESLSVLQSLYVQMHFAALRMTFFLLASWRVIFFLLIVAVFLAKRTIKPYIGRDILGETGTNRLFFSGIQVGLDPDTEDGIPTKQIPGLACPARLSEAAVRQTELFKVLERYEAVNKTNIELLRIILAADKVPGFLPPSRTVQQIDNVSTWCSLGQVAKTALVKVLALHRDYVESTEPGSPCVLPVEKIVAEHTLDYSEYEQVLDYSLDRVLTPAMRRSLRALPSSLIASVFLAQQAGKTLAYAFQAGKWVRKAAFPLLSGRAVLHSIQSYGLEYSNEERQLIRRSLIYGSRQSIFGPVRFPAQMDETTRALRQWIEVCDSMPNEVELSADDVELFGIISTLERLWERELSNLLRDQQWKKTSGAILTSTNLLCLPVDTIVGILLRFIPKTTLERLTLLHKRTHEMRVKRASIALERSDEDATIPTVHYERVFAPLAKSEIVQLATDHDLEREIIESWSSLRLVLSSGSFLARRVGDYSVSDPSIIFLIFSELSATESIPAEDRSGFSQMVALRTSRLGDLGGVQWKDSLRSASTALMTESLDDFRALLRGEEDKRDLENKEVNGLN